MTISVGFHFPTIPTVDHQDFPGERPFTAAILTDDKGVDHHLYLPLGARITVTAGATDE